MRGNLNERRTVSLEARTSYLPGMRRNQDTHAIRVQEGSERDTRAVLFTEMRGDIESTEAQRGKSMKVLIACEFSGIVREAFHQRGHSATSADILPTEIPGDHYQGDVRDILNDGWDLMIAHPPCTYLCAGGHNWMNRRPEWIPNRIKALDFVCSLLNAPIEKLALENPIGVISSQIRKPDQILRAWQFGHPYKKDICLWLKNLPKLIPLVTEKPEDLKTFDFWSTNRFTKTGGNKKSITFQGFADVMADQWGGIDGT